MQRILIIDSNSAYEFLLRSAGYEVYHSKYGDLAYNTSLIPWMDLVLFTGGADVHPTFYKGVHNGTSSTDIARDLEEIALFKHCIKSNVKMTGICRGIQFLNVMCGGKMYQHITNHGGYLHNILFPATDKIVAVSSTHHQLVILPDDALPIAWAYPTNRSKTYVGPEAKTVDPPKHEIEAAVYPKYNAFGVQFHPEMNWCSNKGRVCYLELLADFINMDIADFIKVYAYTGEENGKERRTKATR